MQMRDTDVLTFQGTRWNVDVLCEVRNGFGAGNKTLCDSVSCRFYDTDIPHTRGWRFPSLKIIKNVFMPST